MRLNFCSCVVCGIGLSGASVRGQPASFRGLGDLPGGIELSWGSGVSGDGTAVVGIGDFAFFPGGTGSQAFRWTAAEGMVGLGYVSGFTANSGAFACSANGAVIVGQSADANNGQAFMWTEGDGMIGLGDLPGGRFYSIARGTSGDGSVIVGEASVASGSQAFVWTAAGGMVGLGHLPGGDGLYGATASGVSADGSVVVGIDGRGSGTRAFRWTAAGGMVALADLPGSVYGSGANAISADGRIVVGTGAPVVGDAEALRWDEEGVPHGLGDFPGGDVFSQAVDVSGDGSIVVGTGSSDFGIEPFIWDAQQGMRNLQSVLVNDFGLNLDGWQLQYVTCISDDGRTMAGVGQNPSDGAEAWVATIPEPGTAVLMLFLLACGRARAGRR